MTRRLILVALALAAALCGHPVALAGDTPTATAAPDMRERAMEALSWGDFDELVALQQEAIHASVRDKDGFQQITPFGAGLATLWNIGTPEATDAYFANLDALTASWLETHPQSSLARALRMRALYARAWWYRGDGYARTVSPQQFALFERYIQAALASAQGEPIRSDDEMSHVYLVMIARSASLDWRTQRALAEDTLATHPEALGLWQELLTSAEPRWGGDWDVVKRLVLDAATRQKTLEDGDVMYARLWVDASFELRGEFFRAPVDWIRLKRGLRSIVTHFPNSGSVNDFAKLACLRQDRAAAQDMMDRLGDEADLRQWGGGNEARSAFDQCRRWLREPDALPPIEGAPEPAKRTGNTQS